MKAFAPKLSIMLEKVFGRTIIGTEQEGYRPAGIINFTVEGRNIRWFAKVTIPHWHSPSLGSKIRSREHQI
jgi:hypothetical protein